MGSNDSNILNEEKINKHVNELYECISYSGCKTTQYKIKPSTLNTSQKCNQLILNKEEINLENKKIKRNLKHYRKFINKLNEKCSNSGIQMSFVSYIKYYHNFFPGGYIYLPGNYIFSYSKKL